MSKNEIKKFMKEIVFNSGLYTDIRQIIEQSRAAAYRAVNFAMVQTYWQIGKRIVEEEQQGNERAAYGESLLKNLSEKLSEEFGKGFDERNLRYMRLFFLTFPIWNALRSELSWTHYRQLLKVEKVEARKFYMVECANSHWSTRQLERQINSLLFERLALSKDKDGVLKLANEGQTIEHAADLIKDPFVLEFTGIKPNSHCYESNLEQALIDKLQEFMLELGKGFSFVARQHRITHDNDHYYIDLVFYNYLLKCFVLIDLKTNKLTFQDIGQMDSYVRLWEEKMKVEGDNPTIGIILCTEKNETTAKYSLLNGSEQIFATRYKLYLPTEKQLQDEIERQKQWFEKIKE